MECITNQIMFNQVFNFLFRYDYLNWWSQSFLVGTPTIICGYRDSRSGIVENIKVHKVSDLPHLAKVTKLHFFNNSLP